MSPSGSAPPGRRPGSEDSVRTSQAPELGRARRILGRYHVTGAFWFRFHQWGMTFLPSWAVGPVIVLFTTFFFFTLRRIRRAIRSNLEPALGPCGWLEAQLRIWRTMWSHAWCNSERYERLSTDRDFRVDVEGLEHWPGADEMDTGLVLVTAHVGAWDVGSFLPREAEGRHVHVVREQEMDDEAQKFIETLYRERTEEQFTTHFSRNNPILGPTLLAALRRGEVVGIQGDRAATTGRTAPARLLGRSLHLPAGPAALARAAGCLTVPVFCFREGRRRYRLVIREPVRPRSDSGGGRSDRDRELARVVGRLADEISWAIRERPHQWFCFRRLWDRDGNEIISPET